MQEHRITVSRRARFQVLGDLDTASEVWIVLHGYGQLAAEFLPPFAPIVSESRAVVAPEALNRYYKEKAGEQSHSETPVGATWMTREDREAEIADYVDFLDAVADRVAGDHKRIVALGFSQGVATVT
ncbi:MAG: esterase, partial [Gemmatimonadaceae bacterium]